MNPCILKQLSLLSRIIGIRKLMHTSVSVRFLFLSGAFNPYVRDMPIPPTKLSFNYLLDPVGLLYGRYLADLHYHATCNRHDLRVILCDIMLCHFITASLLCAYSAVHDSHARFKFRTLPLTDDDYVPYPPLPSPSSSGATTRCTMSNRTDWPRGGPTRYR